MVTPPNTNKEEASSRGKKPSLLFGWLLGSSGGCLLSIIYTILLTLYYMFPGILELASTDISKPYDYIDIGVALFYRLGFVLMTLAFALIIGLFVGIIPATILGGLTGIIIGGFLGVGDQSLTSKRAFALGCLIALPFVATYKFLLLPYIPGIWENSELPITSLLVFYAAWSGIPLIVYVLFSGYLAWQMRK